MEFQREIFGKTHPTKLVPPNGVRKRTQLLQALDAREYKSKRVFGFRFQSDDEVSADQSVAFELLHLANG